MKFDHKHTLTSEEAQIRLQALGEFLTNRHGLRVNWAGGRGTISGRYLVVTIEGVLTFSEGIVHFDGKDPGLLWRKKAVNYLKRKLGMYLDPDTPLDELPRN